MTIGWLCWLGEVVVWRGGNGGGISRWGTGGEVRYGDTVGLGVLWVVFTFCTLGDFISAVLHWTGLVLSVLGKMRFC